LRTKGKACKRDSWQATVTRASTEAPTFADQGSHWGQEAHIGTSGYGVEGVASAFCMT
jgi:hypothetical protein